MDDDQRYNLELAAEVERMMREGELEGLAIRLRRSFPSLAEEADAAIGHGVEKLIRREAVTNPAAYLAACAYNEMKRLWRSRARADSLEALQGREGTSWEPRDEGWTVEEQALVTETYKQCRGHVETWDNGHVREVVLLYLEAAFVGEPLPAREAASLLSQRLDEEVDEDFLSTWKSRGFKRLKKFIREQEGQK